MRTTYTYMYLGHPQKRESDSIRQSGALSTATTKGHTLGPSATGVTQI